MNIMFDDRQFLLVPWVDGETPLAERLAIANQRRSNPFKLAFLDDRTERKYRQSDKPASEKGKWAFYLPKESCPLNYRELALWFVLWSIKPKNEPYFASSLSGIEKLVGLGKRQAYILARRLEERRLIAFDTSGRSTWFCLRPYTLEHADWFRPINEIPKRILIYFETLESESSGNEERTQNIKMHPEPTPAPPVNIANMTVMECEDLLNELNTSIPPNIKERGGVIGRRHYWNSAKERGYSPTYNDEDGIVVKQLNDRIEQVRQSNEVINYAAI